MGARDWASGLSARHGADTGRRGRLPANIGRAVEMVRVLADYGSENSRSRPGSLPRRGGGRSRQTQWMKRARSGSRPVQPDRRRPGQARRRNRKPGRVVTTLARSRAGHRVRPWARDRTIAETGPAGARRLHLVWLAACSPRSARCSTPARRPRPVVRSTNTSVTYAQAHVQAPVEAGHAPARGRVSFPSWTGSA